MGNQGTAAHGLRRAVELVQAGEIGPVKEVHVWTNRPIWPQAPQVTDQKPPKPAPKPDGVHWDEFLGPAADRPYAGGIHPFAWRGCWDFGTGAIGDMACHTANMAFMALKLGHPNHAAAEAGDVNPLTCPSYAHVTLKFPARGDMPPVTLHWYEGKKDGKKVLPPPELVAKALKVAGRDKLVESGSILVGSKGIAYSPERLRVGRVLRDRDPGQATRRSRRSCRPTAAGTPARRRSGWRRSRPATRRRRCPTSTTPAC